MDMYAHLLSITSDEECRSGRNEGHGDPPGAQGEEWFPGAADYCNAMCGATFEPFWDQCGATLSSMNMGGMEEMGAFCECARLVLLCSAPFCLSAQVAPHGGLRCRRFVPPRAVPTGPVRHLLQSAHVRLLFR